MTDHDGVIGDDRYPAWRARLVPDLDAGEPYGDALAPALIVDGRGARAAREVYQPVRLDRILAAWQHYDEPLFLRYLRIVHGTTIVERVEGPQLTVLVFDTADYRAHVGTSVPVDLSGERDEWRAWLDGDVYGVIIEHHDSAEDTWYEVDSLFGLYGATYATDRGRDLIAEYATHPPTAPATFPTIRLMLDLDIAHLPLHVYRQLGGFDGVVAFETDFGLLMWVPADPPAHAADYTGIPAEVLAVQRYARRHGCDYVRFDTDAHRVADLPAWDW